MSIKKPEENRLSDLIKANNTTDQTESFVLEHKCSSVCKSPHNNASIRYIIITLVKRNN